MGDFCCKPTKSNDIQSISAQSYKQIESKLLCLAKKIAVSKFFTYCDSIILPLFSSEISFTSLLRSQHLGYLPCRFAARRLGLPVVRPHPVRSLARPVGQPAPGHRISPSPC